MKNCAYVNNTGFDVRVLHSAIMDAIKNAGKFGEDLADVFMLSKNPSGSGADYSLDFVEGENP